jgi:hypothetical protein
MAHCWYCSIPQLTLAKLSLLNCWIWFDVGAQSVHISHPQLAAAERYRAAQFARSQRTGYKGMPGNPVPVKHQWVVSDWTSATPEDWDRLTTEIAEQVARYHWSFLP